MTRPALANSEYFSVAGSWKEALRRANQAVRLLRGSNNLSLVGVACAARPEFQSSSSPCCFLSSTRVQVHYLSDPEVDQIIVMHHGKIIGKGRCGEDAR